MTLTEAAAAIFPIEENATNAHRIAQAGKRKAYTAGYKDAMNDQIHLRNLEKLKDNEQE